jgi:hypothetical protein
LAAKPPMMNAARQSRVVAQRHSTTSSAGMLAHQMAGVPSPTIA